MVATRATRKNTTETGVITQNNAFNMDAKKSVAGIAMNVVKTRRGGKKKNPAVEKMESMYATLTDKQKQVFDLVMQGESLLVLGGGGTGKSWTTRAIQHALQNVYNKNVITVAFSGIAARNIGGCTLHRTLGLPLGPCLTSDGKEILTKSTAVLTLADWVIVDEIGTLRIDQADCLWKSIKASNAKRAVLGKEPIKVLLIGDPYQIEPVLANDSLERELLEKYYNNPEHSVNGRLGKGWFFNSRLFQDMGLKTIILRETKRQSDIEAIKHLNAIREGKIGFADYINANTSQEEFEDSLTIFPYNVQVRNKNIERLRSLPGAEYTFIAKLEGRATPEDFPGTYELKLKRGAKIMFLSNDNPKRVENAVRNRPDIYMNKELFTNGTFGVVLDIYQGETENDDYLVVENEDGDIFELKRELREIFTYAEKDGKLIQERVGSSYQLPIQLGWSISIHKSQGQTHSKINVFPKQLSSGQLYVALSRCKSFEGMHLIKDIDESELFVDEEVQEFFANLKEYTPSQPPQS